MTNQIQKEKDTVKLLKECDAGIKMGIAAIDDVFEYTKSDKLNKILSESKIKHEMIQQDLNMILDRYNDDGKDPNKMAKGMSWVKTNMKLAMETSDETIADLITDGCNMGVKSLNRYINEYSNADKSATDIAKRLIGLEEQLALDVSKYL